jgi:hypothetical protein
MGKSAVPSSPSSSSSSSSSPTARGRALLSVVGVGAEASGDGA